MLNRKLRKTSIILIILSVSKVASMDNINNSSNLIKTATNINENNTNLQFNDFQTNKITKSTAFHLTKDTLINNDTQNDNQQLDQNIIPSDNCKMRKLQINSDLLLANTDQAFNIAHNNLQISRQIQVFNQLSLNQSLSAKILNPISNNNILSSELLSINQKEKNQDFNKKLFNIAQNNQPFHMTVNYQNPNSNNNHSDQLLTSHEIHSLVAPIQNNLHSNLIQTGSIDSSNINNHMQSNSFNTIPVNNLVHRKFFVSRKSLKNKSDNIPNKFDNYSKQLCINQKFYPSAIDRSAANKFDMISSFGAAYITGAFPSGLSSSKWSNIGLSNPFPFFPLHRNVRLQLFPLPQVPLIYSNGIINDGPNRQNLNINTNYSIIDPRLICLPRHGNSGENKDVKDEIQKLKFVRMNQALRELEHASKIRQFIIIKNKEILEKKTLGKQTKELEQLKLARKNEDEHIKQLTLELENGKEHIKQLILARKNVNEHIKKLKLELYKSNGYARQLEIELQNTNDRKEVKIIENQPVHSINNNTLFNNFKYDLRQENIQPLNLQEDGLAFQNTIFNKINQQNSDELSDEVIEQVQHLRKNLLVDGQYIKIYPKSSLPIQKGPKHVGNIIGKANLPERVRNEETRNNSKQVKEPIIVQLNKALNTVFNKDINGKSKPKEHNDRIDDQKKHYDKYSEKENIEKQEEKAQTMIIKDEEESESDNLNTEQLHTPENKTSSAMEGQLQILDSPTKYISKSNSDPESKNKYNQLKFFKNRIVPKRKEQQNLQNSFGSFSIKMQEPDEKFPSQLLFESDKE